MFRNLLCIVNIILIALFVVSCSSDDKDIKGAISVFKSSAGIKVADYVKDKKITIPKQVRNKFWIGSNKPSLFEDDIENFAFANKITKKKTYWSGFRTGNNDKRVFRPIIVENTLYILDAKGNLIARNKNNFKRLWKKYIFDKKDRKDFVNGKIFYYNERIFAISGFNNLVAVDAKNGNVIWSKKISSIPVSAPVVSNNQIFVTTSDNETYVFDADSGQINWIHEGIDKDTAILGAADPVFYKNYVIVSYSSGEIYILKQKNGDIGWSHDLNINKATNSDFVLNDIDATPIIKDGVVYAVGNGGKMMAIEIINGNIIWQKEIASIVDFWIAGDFIYLVSNDNYLMAIDKLGGGVKWFVKLDDEKDPKDIPVYNGVVMAGDNLVLSNSKNEILLVSPLDGSILQRKKVGKKIFHSPIVVDGKIYLNTLGRFTVDVVILS